MVATLPVVSNGYCDCCIQNDQMCGARGSARGGNCPPCSPPCFPQLPLPRKNFDGDAKMWIIKRHFCKKTQIFVIFCISKYLEAGQFVAFIARPEARRVSASWGLCLPDLTTSFPCTQQLNKIDILPIHKKNYCPLPPCCPRLQFFSVAHEWSDTSSAPSFFVLDSVTRYSCSLTHTQTYSSSFYCTRPNKAIMPWWQTSQLCYHV